MSVGIKETLECFVVVEELASAISKAKEDGEIGVLDLRHLPPVISSLREAIKDSKEIKIEIADLSKEELEQLVGAAIKAGMAVVEAVTK